MTSLVSSQNSFMPYQKLFIFTCIVLSFFILSGCSTKSKEESITRIGDIEIYDPYENFNRGVFQINEGLDAVIFEPAAIVYRGVLPQFARDGIHNFLENLKSPVYLANELLQGDWEDAGLVTKRFAVNTVAGIGGLIDVAGMNGERYLPEDFGQTLAVWGAGDGAYFVLPIFGPATARDSFGRLIDMGFDPLFWYGINDGEEAIGYIRTGATILDAKDRSRDAINDLRNNSLDFYAAVRSVVYQRRQALILDQDMTSDEGRSNAASSIDIPDYDDEDY